MLIKSLLRILIVTLFIVSIAIQASEKKPYAGQQTRSIKSLSNEDIHSLKTGKGWGLAKPAELNGVPGPAHILELKDQLALSEKQLLSIQALWDKMNQSARQYGELYLQSEEKIEQFFNSSSTDETVLSQLLTESASHLAELRYIHLQTHLKAKPILTQHQIVTYNTLRGYTDNSHSKGHKHAH